MIIDPRLVFKCALGLSLLILVICLALSRATPSLAEGPQDASLSASTSVEKPEHRAEDACALNGDYPQEVLQWCGLIIEYAGQNGLPPDLVAGLIWYESGGDALAYSRSGAVGLMQVMPRDGLAAEFTCVNGPCFASRPSRAELEDPEFNIAFGTRMLGGLVSRYQDLREALRAYGPMNAGYAYADKVLAIYARNNPQ